MDITLVRLNHESLPSVLSMKMTEAQKKFLAPNIVSLAQAAAWLSEGRGVEILTVMGEEQTIGFVLLERTDEETHLHRFMIDESFQNRGAGTATLKELIKREADRGADIFSLTCFPENEAAIRLYVRLGFRASGKIIDSEAEYMLNLKKE